MKRQVPFGTCRSFSGGDIIMAKKQIALTFDDGPNTTVTPKVLDLLEQYNIKASFFLIGQNVNEESKKVARRAVEMGCELCNHTFTHPSMPKLTREQMEEEVAKTDRILEELTGKPSIFFRPPYIDVCPEMFEIIPKIFICGVGCFDWEPFRTAEFRAETMLKEAKDGVLYLLHDMDGNVNTVEALKTVIPALLEQDYEFLTVTELFASKQPKFDPERGYEKIPQVVFSNILTDYQ